MEDWTLNIVTTVNIHCDVLDRINRAAAILDITDGDMIVLLLRKFHQANRKQANIFSRVTYQRRDVKENWTVKRVVWCGIDYELFLDLRKLYKMSVSLLLAYSAYNYIDIIIEELGDEVRDNSYQLNDYKIDAIIIKDDVIWLIYWGNTSKNIGKNRPPNIK